MLNRDVYFKPPSQLHLLNNGVVKVSDSRGEEELRTLRFELENFVCDGQYQAGMERILGSFLGNLGKPEQPAAWVSGFYGSGKSHFLKMLRALWTDYTFADGATARGLVHLPDSVQHLLKELTTAGKRTGGLHAASGTLSSGALGGNVGDSVRKAILGIVLQSRDLPEHYQHARFVLWLKKEGKYEAVRHAVEATGSKWSFELSNMYVSPVLAGALAKFVPHLGATTTAVIDTLKHQFPKLDDISNDQFAETLEQALAEKGKMPLTLIALDEIQQYIGENPDRALRIQEVAELCAQRLGSNLQIVGSGQYALTATPQLQRLLGRFQVRIELSDADVNRVVRQVILKKRPDAEGKLKEVLDKCAGEVSRHLQGTSIGHRHEDQQDMVADYPLLPVRRRFWELALRAIDAGTAGQLRNQLGMVLDAVVMTADLPLGEVVPADFLFEKQSTTLVQTAKLSREVFERISSLRTEGDAGVFKARICGLLFLIAKLPRTPGADLGIQATPDILAQLLVTNLLAGSGELRKRVETSLTELETAGIVLNVAGAYTLQTRESSAWEQEYRQHSAVLEANPTQVNAMRGQLLGTAVADLGPIKRGIAQGHSKVPRTVTLHLGIERPPLADKQLVVWVRDGWNTSQDDVVADSGASGSGSSLVYLFIPKVHADAVRANLVRWKAAEVTVQTRPLQQTPEGMEAKAAMETRRDDAKLTCTKLIADVLAQAKVWLGGGQEVHAGDVAASVQKALDSAVVRLYPKFTLADDARWPQVINAAKQNAQAPLDKIGHSGDTDKHAVTKEILQYVGTGKKGNDIRTHFQGSPYGWPQDAIDGALYALGAGGHLRATLAATGVAVDIRTQPQNQLTLCQFKSETIVVTAQQRVALAGLAQAVGATVAQQDPATTARNVLKVLHDLAAQAGGDAPRPQVPNTLHLGQIGAGDGNELVVKVVTEQEKLRQDHKTWKAQADLIAARLPRWQTLQQLASHATSLPEATDIDQQVRGIESHRSLCSQPDPVPPQCDALVQALRKSITAASGDYKAAHDAGMDSLKADANWQKLKPEDKHELLQDQDLNLHFEVKLGTESEVLACIAGRSLQTWKDKTDALPGRFQNVRKGAAKILEPKVTYVKVPNVTLRNDQDLQAWLTKVQGELTAELAKGPVHVH
jgi:hypothetical protein